MARYTRRMHRNVARRYSGDKMSRLIEAKNFPVFGRGVVAIDNINEGTCLEVCPVLPLTTEDTVKVNETSLKQYTFVFDKEKKQDCLVMGLGELYNHSDTPNVGYRLNPICKTMEFYTLRPVVKGEQLFINYRADDETVSLEDYFNG